MIQVKVVYRDLQRRGAWNCIKMGVMSRKVVPACGSLCFFCPSLRARSRQPVKRYKKLLGEIFPKSQVNFLFATINLSQMPYFFSWPIRLANALMFFFLSNMISRSSRTIEVFLISWLLSSIFFLSHALQDAEPNDRKIVKLCEYASRNPLRIPKVKLIFMISYNSVVHKIKLL